MDFAVFDAKSHSGSDSDNAPLLFQLTAAGRLKGLKVDQSALAYADGAQIRFYGSTHLVDYLARTGLPQWTHWIDV